jgi:hypothetical protein
MNARITKGCEIAKKKSVWDSQQRSTPPSKKKTPSFPFHPSPEHILQHSHRGKRDFNKRKEG